eukprot:XP_001707674.1 Hypothetical protein GL50803_34626 [Giardia lamblia ATCC 50803]
MKAWLCHHKSLCELCISYREIQLLILKTLLSNFLVLKLF